MAIRTLSTLPISVGTGLAIEMLTKEFLFKYDSFLINIRTLVRNAHEAYDESKGEIPNVDEVVEAVKEDIINIAQTINDLKLRSSFNIYYYYPSYSGLKSMFPLAKIKDYDSMKPSKQKTNYDFREKVLGKVYKLFDKIITKNNVVMPEFNGEGIVLTHYPVDLATSPSYTRLSLLESHTGTIKRFNEFYTKLTNGKELEGIPLNKLTIQVFGDNSEQFYAMPFKIKNIIKELSVSSKWTSSSTPSFVSRSIRSLQPSPDKEVLMKMI